MEYQLFMGLEGSIAYEKAIADLIDRLKNPILDQPKQLWHRGSGIYVVVKAFASFKYFDFILLDSYIHGAVVKLATPCAKQEFIPWTKEINAQMAFTPEEWKSLRLPTKKELWKLLPHLSVRIRNLCGYYQYMSFYPEYLCTDCFTKLGLELQAHSHVGSWCKHCKKCGKQTPVTTHRNSLKSINRQS